MYTLFDVLTGNIKDSNNIYNEAILHQSIKDHLTLLLNTRQGSLQHIPEYGLPDLNAIYQGLPGSIVSFSRLLSKVIEQYEPRLTQVAIINKPYYHNHNDCVIYLEINAKIKQANTILFDTYCMSGGEIIIETQ